jgi:hypothetical protein
MRVRMMLFAQDVCFDHGNEQSSLPLNSWMRTRRRSAVVPTAKMSPPRLYTPHRPP